MKLIIISLILLTTFTQADTKKVLSFGGQDVTGISSAERASRFFRMAVNQAEIDESTNISKAIKKASHLEGKEREEYDEYVTFLLIVGYADIAARFLTRSEYHEIMMLDAKYLVSQIKHAKARVKAIDAQLAIYKEANNKGKLYALGKERIRAVGFLRNLESTMKLVSK